MYVDASGTCHPPAQPGARIVSLVPSISELVCSLGLTNRLVGRTGFCVHPREVVRRIPKVGGTKDVDIDAVRALSPTHVIVNIDENRRETADALRAFVPHVIVTHPCAPEDNLVLYRLIGGIFGAADTAEALCAKFTTAYDTCQTAGREFPRRRALYLIWRDPWMSVARDTYIARTLALAGYDTIPAAADRRYPEIDLASVMASGVDHVLLSSEPYRFTEQHVAQLREQFPGPTVALIDGEMTSWYGSRAIEGMGYLPAFRRTLERA